MDISDQFGGALRIVRQRRGYSQEQLAELSQLHRTYVGSVERGERNITLRNAAKLADALGISLSELLRLAETMPTKAKPPSSRNRRRESQ